MKGQPQHARRPSTKTVQQSKWKKNGVETTNQIFKWQVYVKKSPNWGKRLRFGHD